MSANLPANFALSVQRYRHYFKQDTANIQQALLNASADHAAAINLAGLIVLEKQQYAQAEQMFLQAIRLAQTVPEYLINLATVYLEQRQLALAEDYFRRALVLVSDQPEALVGLAYSLQLQHRYTEAIPIYKQVLPYSEQLISVLINLGKCLEASGKLLAAGFCYEKALLFVPEHAIALYNLAGVYQQQGQHKTAIDFYRQALSCQPDFVNCHYNLAVALLHDNQLTVAEQAFLQVLSLVPDYLPALQTLADLYAFQGYVEQAIHYYQLAYAVKPSTGIAVRSAALLAPIPNSTQQIIEQREKTFADLQQFLTQSDLSISDPVTEVRDSFFYFSYHGVSNRALKTALYQVFSRACPSLLWTSPHCQQARQKSPIIKIGLLSKYFYQHSIGKTSQGFFAHLPRDKFKVYALFIPPVVDDPLSAAIKAQADEVLVLTSDLQQARAEIANLALDILFYQDIGMEPLSYFLAYARLALVQCTSFGHPDTTGIANMDYFISSQLFETVDADSHYSEQLYQLPYPSLLSYYSRPTLPTLLKQRSDFGFDDQEHLYCCPQSLFKFHPDFDHILAAILRQDKQGKLVLLSGTLPAFKQALLSRFQTTLPDVLEQVIFLPAQSFADFLQLLAVVDVLLDIPQFNGMNTSLEAFSVGTPVVTLPGGLQRSRHGAGLYRKMAIEDCIAIDAEDYVNIALRLANDSAFAKSVREKILANCDHLFADQATIDAFSDFFQQALKEK